MRAQILIGAAMLVPYSERNPLPHPLDFHSCINDIWGIRARNQICCSFRSMLFSLWQMYVVTWKWPRNHFISEKYKIVNDLSYISFQLVPLCKYTLSSATVKLMETFLEAILWNPFQLFRRIHNCQRHKNAVPSMTIAIEGTGKNQLELGQESMGDAALVSYFSLLRNPWPKPAGVLEHYREGETNCWFSTFRGVSFWPHS